MLHNMGLFKGDHTARLKRHDIDMHVMAQIVGFHKARGAPCPIGIWHQMQLMIGLMGDKGLRSRDPLNRHIEFTDPMKPQALLRCLQLPLQSAGNIGVAARPQSMRLPVQMQHARTLGDKKHRLRPGVCIRLTAATTGGDFHDILRKRLSKTAQGPCENPGACFVPMGQKAGDDIAHRALGDDRIGLGKDRALSHNLLLARQASSREIIFLRVAHGISFQDRSIPSAKPRKEKALL